MFGVFAILLLSLYLVFVFPIRKKKTEDENSTKSSVQVKKLWTIAQSSMRERKPVRAEKALLAILKLDKKNAAAYNRLGILYAKGQKYNEAIECFEIAQSLDNNASSLHNVGLIYLETGEYEKATMAFQQAIEIEGDVPARFIALSKAQEKIGNRKAALEALESAYSLDSSLSTLKLILAIHEANNNEEEIENTKTRIEAQLLRDQQKKKAVQLQRRRISNSRSIAQTNKNKTTSIIPKQTTIKRRTVSSEIKKPTRNIQIRRKIQ